MSFTLNEIALLLIAMAIGLVLGLMLSGRGKYKRAFRDERRDHAETVKAQAARDKAAEKRIAELEAQQARPASPAATTPVGTHESVPARDELSRISGIDPQREIALNEAGYHRYDQIAAMNAEQEATMEARLGLTPGTIARDDWRGQARSLQGQRKTGLFGRPIASA